MGLTLLNRIKTRHLYGSGDTLSKFYFEDLMLHCIDVTLSAPDFSYREKDGKFVNIKRFPFGVGDLGIARRPTDRVKVVFSIEYHHVTVVSAFPCA